MFYYDIHTHGRAAGDNIISIYNMSPQEVLSGIEFPDQNTCYSAGIHPWHAATSVVGIDALITCLSRDRVVAVGEIGLDKLCGIPLPLQIEIFEEQIKLSIDFNLPVVIHCVKAWDELLALYKKYKPGEPWIIHGFRGGGEQARQLVKWGFMLSVGQYYNQEALRAIYPDHLLLETDDNEQGIENVYQKVCKDLNCELYTAMTQISQNVTSVFNLSRFCS